MKRSAGLAHVPPNANAAPPKSKRGGKSNARGSSSLLALGSAAVMAVYAAGFMRTKPAADRMAAETAEGPRRRAPNAAGGVSVAALTAPGAVAAPTGVAPTGGVVEAAPPPAAALSSGSSPALASKDVPKSEAVVVDAPKAEVPKADAPKADAPKPESKPAETTTAATVAEVAPQTPSAPPPAAAPAEAPAPAPAKVVYKDGAYIGRGTSRHGDIEAMVEIKDGRIVSTIITQCLTRYSCSWVNPLIPQVAQRQSAEIDYVSGATQSSNALYYAVLQALSQAK